jgi:hypothetical protein
MCEKIETNLIRLGLRDIHDTEISENIIKRQYHKMARIYHPDKNSSKDAAENFRQLHESYESTMRYYGYLEDDTFSLEEDENIGIFTSDESWFSYIQPFMQSDIFLTIQSKILHSIMSQLYMKCESKAYSLIEQLDAYKLEKMIGLLKTNRQLFHISDEFIGNVEKMYTQKQNASQTVIVRPMLVDLIDEQVYKLEEKSQIYYIPLWHHELIYDIDGRDLCITIEPDLEENIEIDDKNNVYVYKQMTLCDVWQMQEIEVEVGKRRLKIPRADLKMRPIQKFVFPNQGIPRISTQNIYDVSRKSNLVITLMIVYTSKNF